MTTWALVNGYRARVRWVGGKCVTTYEHREVMAKKLGRPLRSDEHVHHKDHNRANNDPDNLEILSPSEHGREHAPQPRPLTLVCALCHETFKRRGKEVRANLKRGKAGPFCGRRCAGRWSRAQQLAKEDAHASP